MKKTTFILFTLFSLLFTPSLFAFTTSATGKELLEYCQIAMDIHDKQFGNPQTEPDYILGAKTGICEGYIMSANEMRLHGKMPQTDIKFCLPPNFNLLIGASVVVKYLKDHPNQENLPASLLVARSLEMYFPCMRG